MVATSHPLASQAGLEALKKGGNAVDAAVAAAAALTVVEPTANGIGSDAFAIIWQNGKLHGLNGSGPSPRALSREQMSGMDKIPAYGWPAVMTPAAPAVWSELSRTMGRLPLDETLSGAVSLAEVGHAVSVTVAAAWRRAKRIHSSLAGPEFAPWRETFLFEGKAPRPGMLCRLPDHAATLRAIGESGARSFYEGETAQRIVSFAAASGGLLSAEDLTAFKPQWVEPISVNYRGYDVFELPPNGQGIVALIALALQSGFDVSSLQETDYHHIGIEAMKLGFADAKRYVADPNFSPDMTKNLLAESYIGQRRGRIAGQAQEQHAGEPLPGGTVYLAAADGEGCMVSLIQSNYMGFGSFVTVPGTGVSLNNRGHCFSLDESHPNCISPCKRPYNTIIPGFLCKDGKPLGPFGVMGGFMQPQGHLQVLTNMIDRGMNPQEALDAPRWQWTGGMDVEVEPGFDDNTAARLARRGHRVTRALAADSFGRGQIILRTDEGTLTGGTEKRADGSIAAW